MYSAVLMLALTAGNEAVDFGKARCSCACSTTCSVTYVGCTSSCSSCSARHGLFGNRCHGCTSCSTVYTCSASSCHSCSSSCHHGGLFGRRNNCCCAPVYSCTSGCSAVIVTPVEKKKDMPKGEKIDGPKKEEASVRSATIVVSLPANAKLTVDGAATTSTSAVRTLVTPALEVGATYVYTMQAEVTVDGRVQTQTQQVTVRGGETSNVNFSFSASSVASR